MSQGAYLLRCQGSRGRDIAYTSTCDSTDWLTAESTKECLGPHKDAWADLSETP